MTTGTRPARWETLRRSLRGDLLRPADARYDQARRPFWAQFDTIEPTAVALCETPGDVAACLAFCQDNDLHAAPRSGGHSTAGYSTTTGVIIDVSRMSQARTDGVTAMVGPGTRQVDALTALWRDGVTIPAGLCPTVCVGGFVTGGGFYPRLTRIKRQYDPHDFFSFAQSVGVEERAHLLEVQERTHTVIR